MNVELAKNGLKMTLDRVRRDHQGFGNLFVRHTLGDPLQHFTLAPGQASQLAIVASRRHRSFHSFQKSAPVERLLAQAGEHPPLRIGTIDLFCCSHSTDDNRRYAGIPRTRQQPVAFEEGSRRVTSPRTSVSRRAGQGQINHGQHESFPAQGPLRLAIVVAHADLISGIREQL